MTGWQVAVAVVTIALVYLAGYLHGEETQRRAELRHQADVRRLLEEIHRERGAITLDAVGWLWAALTLWAAGVLAVWWFGS